MGNSDAEMRRFLGRIPDRPSVMIGAGRNEADRNGMNGAHAKRLAQLSERLASARQADTERYRRFFMVLGERRESARIEECEQDRLHARRFNAFDYLRTDELGLSQIIKDLLEPNGPHGQEASFLERFRNLVGSHRWPADGDVGAGYFDARVVPERMTHGGRYLDISVQLTSSAREPACIAIENKPYASISLSLYSRGERGTAGHFRDHCGHAVDVRTAQGRRHDGKRRTRPHLRRTLGKAADPGSSGATGSSIPPPQETARHPLRSVTPRAQ